MDLASILTQIDDVLYTWLLIYLLAGSGIYFSVRTRFVQVRRFKDALHCMMEKKEGDKGVSSFQALMIATASRVGTGNMAGVATAIILGGPGAAFWMWLMAVLGSASAFIESTLAQIYKKREGDSFKGGPAYYIERALGSRPLGIVFAISLIATFAFGFNGLQAYNIVSAFAVYTTNLESSILPTAIGIILAIAAFYIFFAGDVIGKISSVLVPAMAALYIAIGVFVIVTSITKLPSVLAIIMADAFNFKSIFGGFTGSCMVLGIKRGLFSNEAGMGYDSFPDPSDRRLVRQRLFGNPASAAVRGKSHRPRRHSLCDRHCLPVCLYFHYRKLLLRGGKYSVHNQEQGSDEHLPGSSRPYGLHRRGQQPRRGLEPCRHHHGPGSCRQHRRDRSARKHCI